MPRKCEPTDPTCPVSRAIAVLQEKWVLHIVHALLDGPRGFNELGREVGGCNPTTLAQRLARLEEAGLVTRIQDACGGGRSGYALTDAGAALSDVIGAIRSWSVQYLHSAEMPSASVAFAVPDRAAPAEPTGSRPTTGPVAAGTRVTPRTRSERDAPFRALSAGSD